MTRGKAKRLAVTLLASLACALLPAAQAAPRKATIAVDFPGSDPLTTDFRKALHERIAEDTMLELTGDADRADIRVVSPSDHIDWDTLNGRIVAIYIVNVKSVWGRSFRLSGVCFADDVKKCATDFVRRTRYHAIPPAQPER